MTQNIYAPSGRETQEFIDAAVDCIGWTTVISNGDGSDILGYMDGHDDWDNVRAIVEAENRDELEGFLSVHYGDLMQLSPDMSQHGHDYVLTAGGHGAGFWDMGYPADIERPVSASARAGTSSHLSWLDGAGTLHYSQG